MLLSHSGYDQNIDEVMNPQRLLWDASRHASGNILKVQCLDQKRSNDVGGGASLSAPADPQLSRSPDLEADSSSSVAAQRSAASHSQGSTFSCTNVVVWATVKMEICIKATLEANHLWDP